jgi:hypothetical protein
VLFVFTSALMFALRFCADFIEKKIGMSPVGILLVCAILACVGLNLTSQITAFAGAMVALTVYGIGKTFFWPTMVGFIAENYPKTGALGLAIIGGSGMLSVSFVLPIIGKWYDAGIAARSTPGVTPSADALGGIPAAAGLEALGKVAVLPAILSVVFILIAITRRKTSPAAAHQS